jgi:DNA-binding SARP family transcriptional activator/tetratricopeptide (TPR) repeat protein
MKVKVNFLGIPSVTLNDKAISFKYQKAEAVFYYAVYHKTVDRFRLMTVFWPDEPEENARKNLRNALYSIRQAFGFQVFENLGQRMIALSEQIQFESDLMTAVNKDQEFLQDFIVKDIPAFDEWISFTRDAFREQTVGEIKEKLDEVMKTGGNPEFLYKRLIRLDPYDEASVRALMLHYEKANQISRSIELYNQLEKVLDAELSLQPEPETVQLFKSVLGKRRTVNKNALPSLAHFIGRGDEMERLNQIRQNVAEQQQSGLVLISGEAGVGKTTLLRKFSELSEGLGCRVIEATCHEGDENHRLSAWHPLVMRLGDLLEQSDLKPDGVYMDILSKAFPPFMQPDNSPASVLIDRQDPLYFSAILRGLVELISQIRGHGPIIICLEDIQWLDEWSLEILERLASESGTGRDVLFITTMRSSSADVAWYTASNPRRLKNFDHIELQRFSKDETDQFISAYLEGMPLDSQTQTMIYSESEGNALYLTEILKCLQGHKSFKELPQKIRHIFSSRFNRLSEESRKIAELLSIFPEMISWEDLSALTGKDDLVLLDIAEELIQCDMIREVPLDTNELQYTFSHQKLKEFIYEGQSATKRRLLHKRIGEYFRDQLTDKPSDRLIYPKLIYHFERCGDKRSQLQYRILNLFDYLELSHELFPRIRDQAILRMHSRQDYNTSFIEREIERIDTLMKIVPEAETQGLIQIEYLNMISRYHLIKGDVDLGYSLTQTMISLAQKLNLMDFVYKGYLQLIFHCINQRRIQMMEIYVNQAFQIFRNHADKGELGVLIRLKGYLMLLMNRFKHGEELLMSAAEIFSRPEYREPYALNLVASYYYLGESRRLQNDTDSALSWYLKAEKICVDQGFISHLPLILCGKGIALYDADRMDEAAENLNRAVDFYDHLDFKWGQVPAYAYWALISYREGNYKRCLEYLKKADDQVILIGRVYETGLMLRVKAELCSLARHTKPSKILSNYLNFDNNSYCKAAIRYFTDNDSFTYEKKVLQDIHGICGECSHFN